MCGKTARSDAHCTVVVVRRDQMAKNWRRWRRQSHLMQNKKNWSKILLHTTIPWRMRYLRVETMCKCVNMFGRDKISWLQRCWRNTTIYPLNTTHFVQCAHKMQIIWNMRDKRISLVLFAHTQTHSMHVCIVAEDILNSIWQWFLAEAASECNEIHWKKFKAKK